MGDTKDIPNDGNQAEGTSDAPIKVAGDVSASFQLNEFGETVSFRSTSEGVISVKKADKKEIEVPETIGRYKIESVLGKGGFGAVYLGHDGQLDRKVAIKVPLLRASQDSLPDAEEFLSEARQLAQLAHPNIVTVYDVGVEDGICYIISDFIEGQDLNRWLQGRTPSWQEAAKLVAAAADALAAAHTQSIIHRDVKPDNLIVSVRAEGIVPILVDFGLALSDKTKAMPGNERGQISGTPNYMSPEQARGHGHRIDGRTDVYALGVILYRMISGRLPFHSPDIVELLQQVIEDEPRPPRQFVHGIPRELERICLKAMSKGISDRHATAGDLAADLRALLKQHEAEVEAARAAMSIKEKSTAREATKILIADDHELSRFKLQTDLEKWGHEVTAAEDGEQAWEMFQKDEFSIVITDWMMPNVDGLELVQRIRDGEKADYVYLIMLTAKAEKHDIVTGMGAGADDFLTKPFHRDELQVRLRAGTRITKLNRELNEINRRLKRSQEAAAQIQRSFIPTTKPDIEGFDFAWDHRSCDELGGDMLNVVRLNDKHLGMYVLDVTGEGVPAALLAINLSRSMSAAADDNSMLVERTNDGSDYRILDPVEVARKLNQKFGDEQEARQYFTLVYGVLNLETREFSFTNAGHPPVLHQQSKGSPMMLDVSGFPIGMAPESEEFNQQSVVLEPGDRLMIYSDGLPDTMNDDGEVFGAARLLESVKGLSNVPLSEMTRLILENLESWRGESDVNDDVSILAISVN